MIDKQKPLNPLTVTLVVITARIDLSYNQPYCKCCRHIIIVQLQIYNFIFYWQIYQPIEDLY